MERMKIMKGKLKNVSFNKRLGKSKNTSKDRIIRELTSLLDTNGK